MFRDNKPTFGGGDFSSKATSTPLGKPTSSGFTAPAFGTGTSTLFGSSPAKSGFVFRGATTTPVFGEAQTTQSKGCREFKFGFTFTGVSGSQPQQTNSPFGKPAFGAATTSATGFTFNSTPTPNILGSQQKPFGTAAPQKPSPFGTPKSEAPSAFVSSSSPFSAFGNQENPTQNKRQFGPKTPFSTTTTTPTFGGFGQPSTNTTNVFNQKPAFGTGRAIGTQTSVGGFGGGLFLTAQNNTGLFSSAFKPQFSFNQPTTSTSSAIGGGLSLGGGSSFFAPAKRNNIFGSNAMGSFETSGFGTMGGLGSLDGGLGNPLLRSSLTERWKLSSRVCSPARPPGWKPPSRGPAHRRFPACPPAGAARGRRPALPTRSHTGASKTSRGSTSAANTRRISDGFVKRRCSALRRPHPYLANHRPTPQKCLTRNLPSVPEELSARSSRVEESVKKTFSSAVSPSSTAPKPDNEPCLQ